MNARVFIAKPANNAVSADHWAMLALTRFMLAMIVFCSHLEGSIGPVGITRFVWKFGELAAVIGFFVISGFSIAHSIEARPERYLLRRFWRIWPTFLVAYLVFTIPTAFAAHYKTGAFLPSAGQFIGGFFMLQGLTVRVVEANAALWTLAIEEWFYLLAPIFRILVSWILIGLIIISAVCYYFSADWTDRFASERWGLGYLCFAWAWLSGFVFYRHRNNPASVLALIQLPILLMEHTNQLGGDYFAATLVFTILVVAFGRYVKLPWDWLRNAFVFLGNVSFPLYIIHYPLFMFLKTFSRGHLHWQFASVAFLISVFVYRWVDAPNRQRWKPKVSGDNATDRPDIVPERSRAIAVAGTTV